MNVTHKDAQIQNTGPADEFPGSFEVILSAPTKDRDGDTLKSEDWKQPLPDHITFDMDHGMSVEKTVGSGVPRIDETTGNLVVAGTYSSLPRAQEVRTLVNEGHIRTTSVAFMTEKSQQKDGTTTSVRELLNGAFVAVPSNREALVLSSKSIEEKAGSRNSKSDAAHIQAIHDHAAALGASHGDESDSSGAEQGATGGKSASTVYVDVVPRMKGFDVLMEHFDELPDAVKSALAEFAKDAEVDTTAEAAEVTEKAADESDDLELRARALQAEILAKSSQIED